MRLRNQILLFPTLGLIVVAMATAVGSARASVLATESFSLPSGPSNPASAPYQDMVVNTSPLEAWGEKGAVGLQGSTSYNGSSGSNLTTPASTVAFKFNIGSVVDSLNATYGAGNWTIAAPTLTVQYTYYANNSIFGGGAGSFETYWVANNNWAFGNGPATGSFGAFTYEAGTDPAYATSAAALLTWAGNLSDLGSTTYNWLSPASNPNYAGWVTSKTGPNQGLLTDNLTLNPNFISAITGASASANDPNVSLYLIPNNSALGLTIFTGGGNSTPTLSFEVISVPEPSTMALAGLCGMSALLRRRRRN